MNKVTTKCVTFSSCLGCCWGIGLIFVPKMIDQTFSILHNNINLSFHMWNMIQIYNIFSHFYVRFLVLFIEYAIDFKFLRCVVI